MKINPKVLASSLRIILLSAALLFGLHLYGDPGADNYAPDIANPFHDVFYLYYNNDKKEAIKLLKKQFNGDRFKDAYINYGLIQENEKNYAEAEKYYMEALKNNKKISIIYLQNLYKNHDKEKLPLIQAAQNQADSYWTLYEKAVYFMEANDKDKAIDFLSQAIDKGFSSADLMLNDSAFNVLKNSFKFNWLVHKAKKNYSKSNSINQKMKEAEYEYKSNKPYGTISEISIAAYYEKTGRGKKALNILSSLIKEKLTFRDRSIALFRLACISARNGDRKAAKEYLRGFIDHISGQEKDPTGYKDIAAPVYKDIILNDESLKKIAGDMM